jgi:hypothetical protein
MENKYYTPTIEEFHIGFECETKDDVSDFDGTIILSAYDTEYLDRLIKNKSVRVKYLDREDIESLGFVCCGKDADFDYIGYNLDNGFQLQQWEKGQYSIERYPTSPTGRTVHFAGIIKNKSELKKLMQQLQII